MKYGNRIAGLLLWVVLLCTSFVPIYAHEIPDENRKGEITLKMRYDGKNITDGTLTAYRVGEIQENNGNYSFVKTSPMEKFSGNYDNIGEPKLAKEVYNFVKEHNIQAYSTVDNKMGKITFTNLDLGLYLIVQTKASNGYELMNPFLVSVPMNEDGNYVYEINAEGKFELHQDKTTTTPSNPSDSSNSSDPIDPSKPTDPTNPTNPTDPSKPPKLSEILGLLDPTLPQTGQLNWPIPVLVILGAVLITIGCLIRFRKEKDQDEK